MQKSLFPFVPFLLLIVPVLEIGVFILLGGQIGVINTLLGIVLTALIGTILLRRQGFALINQAQGQMNAGKVPGKELAHGVMLLAAGLLLLTPGFVTDTFGFLLLVPPIRDGIFAFFKSRITLVNAGAAQSGFSSSNAGGTYYRSYSYSSTQTDSTRNRSADPSVIDLDDDDFSEVTSHDAIEAKPSSQKPDQKDGQSPWEKS
ncbi:FxsA family protein [Cohaesibacter intestini]|uniref:FxsA family protein n=1 Tax=Cohaesibacter intestini TaxID=2211145 RepID=UPI0018E58A9C|nr:FxsA family protein [Cohaesibacter intestini]